jgi:hypothetical protein
MKPSTIILVVTTPLLLSLCTTLFANSYSAPSVTDDVSGSKAPVTLQSGIKLTTKETQLSIGGRIQLHSIYAWPEGAFYAGKIPLEKNSAGEHGQLLMSAKDSRLWVKTRTPTKYGPIRALIETDFLGTASGTETNTNSHGLRLRHAYVQVGSLTLGQTNSAFNAYVTLDTISFAINHTFVRQPLIRYSKEYKTLAYDISLEQPETTLLDTSAAIITPKDDAAPDIITRLRYYPSWGEASVALIGRYIIQDKATLSDGTQLTSSDAAFGWGTNISAKISTYKRDDIRFDVQYGVGLGRYTSFNSFAAGTIDNRGTIKLQSSLGGHIGYRHWWNKELHSTLAISYIETKNNLQNIAISNLDKVNKNASSAQLNLLWIPLKNALVGIEYDKAIRHVESGDIGYMDMVVLLMRYDF